MTTPPPLPRSLAERLALFRRVDVYPVTSQEHSGGRSSLEILDAVIAGGARVVQLREKGLDDRALYDLALVFRKRTRQAGVLLMINDRLDMAMAVGADGIHLGQRDLPIREVKRLAHDLIVGASTHSVDEAIAAQRDGADTINVGPIFPTGTKAEASRFLGLEGLAEVRPHVEVPLTAMGGIKPEHVDDLVAAGARRLAVVTAITKAADPELATRDLAARIRRATGRSAAGG